MIVYERMQECGGHLAKVNVEKLAPESHCRRLNCGLQQVGVAQPGRAAITVNLIEVNFHDLFDGKKPKFQCSPVATAPDV